MLMQPPPQPTNNPSITLSMPLDVFNRMQGILAKQPFEEISELIFFFRNQAAEQVAQQRRAEEQRAQAVSSTLSPSRVSLTDLGESGD